MMNIGLSNFWLPYYGQTKDKLGSGDKHFMHEGAFLKDQDIKKPISRNYETCSYTCQPREHQHNRSQLFTTWFPLEIKVSEG